MKIKLLYLLILLILPIIVKSQIIKDTTIKSPWYFRINPYSTYTSSGGMIDKSTANIEMGKSFGVMDFGLAYGKISYRPDSTSYIETKATMNVGQYGRFSNELIVGTGYVFNSQTPIMFELATTMFGQISDKISIGVITGYYDFSGKTYSSSKNFFGLIIRYGCQRNYNGGLINSTKEHIAHKHRFHK